jgi:uncharacterized protein
MRQHVDPQPLSDAEFDRLGNMLNRLGDKSAMNLEMLDGFFAALIGGPENVLPSEYLPLVWGGGMLNEPDLEEFISLVTKHWNATSHILRSGEVFTPLLLEHDDGIAHANDWAKGFLRGMELRRDKWAVLLDDEDHGGSLVPIFALAHEHHPDPKMRPYKEPIDQDMREKLIVGAAAGVMNIYDYFEAQRLLEVDSDGGATFRRPTPKVGRNEKCPCGSGKKFKHCCGKITMH